MSRAEIVLIAWSGGKGASNRPVIAAVGGHEELAGLLPRTRIDAVAD
jgi:hypothetical protein